MDSMVMRERFAYRVSKRHPTWSLQTLGNARPVDSHCHIAYNYYCFAIVWLSESVLVTFDLVSG